MVIQVNLSFLGMLMKKTTRLSQCGIFMIILEVLLLNLMAAR